MKNEENVVAEPKKEEPKESKPKFRYFCEACTNTALVTSDKKDKGDIKCQVCGKDQPVKAENYIEIN